MAYNPLTIGQQPMSSSQGVVIASNQSPVSVAGTLQITGTPSVSGTVQVGNFPTTQNISGSVVGFQGTSPWIITGSVQGSFTAAANQSVSGTVGASIIGTAPVTQSGTWAVSVVGSLPPQSVSGTVGASIIGTVPTTQSGISITSIVSSIPSSVLVGASIFGQLPAGTAVIGSVATLQGTNPWIITGSVQGSFSPSGNQSVSGTVNIGTGGPVSVVGTMSVLGTVPVTQSTSPWIITGSVQGSFSPSGNQSVSGTVGASVIGTVPTTQTGTWISSIVSTVPSSVLVGASIFGALPGGNNILGAVAASISGTVTVASLVGTYSKNSASVAGTDKGLFVLGIRNDTVASLVGTDLNFSPFTTDSAGRYLLKPFAPDESRLDNQTSVVSGSVTALFSSVTGLRNYVTDIMVANTGSVATLVTFKDGSTSILGYTIAPATSGSNINGMAFPFRTAPGQDFTFSVSPATSVLYVSAKGYKAP